MKRNSFAVGTVHSFSRSLARKHGINAALLLAFFAHRIPSVQAARKDERGYYTSVAVLARHYPYLKPNAIKYALKHLRSEGVLLVDHHNRMACDRTLWYRFAEPTVQQAATEDPIRFNVEAAINFGVEEAIVMANLKYWIDQNSKLDNRNIWLRVSPAKLSEHLPISERTVRRVLQRLVEVHHVLDRKHSKTCDRAGRYCFLVPNSHRSNPTDRRSDQSIQQPIPTIQRPVCINVRSNQPTYTLCEDNLCEDSLEKNLCENPVETSTDKPWVVKTSHTSNDIMVSNSSVPAIEACGSHSGTEFNSPADENSYTDFDLRYDAFKSPYASLEDNADLTAELKSRVFKAGVVAMRKIGSPEGEKPFHIIYDAKSFELARRFFDLNPQVTAGNLLAVLNQCAFMSAQSEAEDGYDPLFFVRHCNNISFFLRYLSRIEFIQSLGLLGECTFLDDIDVSLRTLPEQIKAVVNGTAPEGYTIKPSRIDAYITSQANRQYHQVEQSSEMYS